MNNYTRPKTGIQRAKSNIGFRMINQNSASELPHIQTASKSNVMTAKIPLTHTGTATSDFRPS